MRRDSTFADNAFDLTLSIFIYLYVIGFAVDRYIVSFQLGEEGLQALTKMGVVDFFSFWWR